MADHMNEGINAGMNAGMNAMPPREQVFPPYIQPDPIVQQALNLYMNRLHYRHNTVDDTLRVDVQQMRDQRENYFQSLQWNPNMTLHQSIMDENVSPVEHFIPLYNLLIFTLAIDELIFVILSNSENLDPTPNQDLFEFRKQEILLEGVRLCDRLIGINDLWPDREQQRDHQLMFHFAHRKRNHFRRRQRYMYEPLFPQHFLPNVPNSPTLHGLINITNIYRNMTCLGIVRLQRIQQILLRVRDQRQRYFERRVGNPANDPYRAFREYILLRNTGPNEPPAIHFFPLYFLLIFTRVMEEAIYQMVFRFHVPDHHLVQYPKHHIVNEGLRLYRRLRRIIDQRMNPEMQNNFRVMIEFIDRMSYHFDQRRHYYYTHHY